MDSIMKKISLIFFLTFFYLSLLGCEEQRKGLFLERGIALFDQGKYKESKLEIKSAIQEDPLIAESYYYMALLNEKGKNYKAMRANLLETVKLAPEKTKAQIKLSKVQVFYNELDDASERIKIILDKNPDQLDALAIKASILIRQKRSDEALAIIDEILQKDANNVEAVSLKVVMLIKQKLPDEASALLNPFLQTHNDNLSLHLLKIQIDSLKDDIDAVVADYEELLTIKPDNVPLKFALAKTYQKANKPQKAENILNALITKEPDLMSAKIALLNLIYTSDKEKAFSTSDTFVKTHKNDYKKILLLSKWLSSKNKKNKVQEVLKSALTNSNISDKDKVSLQLLLAQMAFESKNTTEALSYIDKTLDDNPEDNNAKILKSTIHISLNEFSAAKKLLKEVLWQQPKNDAALSQLGKINVINGDLDKAIINYETALKINPQNLQALNFIVNKESSEGHTPYAIEILERALRFQPYNLKLLTQLVELNIKENQFDIANKHINTIQTQKNGIFLAAFLRGNILQYQKKYSEAISAYKSLLEKAPWLKDALTNLAECYSQLNQQSNLLVYLDTLIKNNPDNISPFIIKSQLLSGRKKYNKAITVLTQVLDQKNIKDIAIYTELGRLYRINGNIEKEQEIYLKGLKTNPDSIKLMLSLASSYESKQAYDEAVKLYEKIIFINPRHNVSRNNLATLLLDQYGKDEDIEKAVQVTQSFKQSKHPFFLDTYGWGQLKSNEIEHALSIFKKVILLAPDIPVFRYHLAVAYNEVGNDMSAISELKQALYLGKGNNFEEKVLIEKLLAKLNGR